jgi:hypothetical protein
LIRVGRRTKIERTKRKIGIAAATKAMILKIIGQLFLALLQEDRADNGEHKPDRLLEKIRQDDSMRCLVIRVASTEFSTNPRRLRATRSATRRRSAPLRHALM